jgi:hypothetical protein
MQFRVIGERFLNLVFTFLFIIGLALILGFPQTVKGTGCAGTRSCFYNFNCGTSEGNCITTESSCGGACNTCADGACTCFFYEGHCSQPYVFIDGTPQYHYCGYTCCSYIGFCLS